MKPRSFHSQLSAVKSAKMGFALLVICIAFTVATVSHAEEKSNTTKATQVLCRNHEEVRTIRINKTGSSCQTVYTKHGQDKVVGKSGTNAVCFEVFNRIRKNLETAAWNCKDISESRVSFSLEQ